MPDYSSILERMETKLGNISQIKAPLDSISSKLFYYRGQIDSLINQIKITNVLLLLIVIFLAINTYINFKKYKNNR